MKGFLITVGLIVVAGIVTITQISTICQAMYDTAQTQEGGPAGRVAFEKLRQDSPDEFAKKFDEPFQSRILLCKLAYFLGGDAIFKTVAEDTRASYLESPMVSNDDFAVLLFRLAKVYQDRSADIYFQRLTEISDHFPNVSFKPELDKEIKLVRIRLNI